MTRSRVAVGVFVALAACLGSSGTALAFAPLPMKLPAQGARAAQVSGSGTWLLGIRPTVRARRLAEQHGGRRVTAGAVVIPSGRARAAAAALRGAKLLRYAEPDVRREPASAYDEHPEQWGRAALVPPTLSAPPVGAVRIGILDDRVDRTHPDLAGHTTVIADDGLAPGTEHGTMVASVASGTAGNGGVMGVFPGAPIVSYATDLSCSDIARGIDALLDAGVGVINLSFGSPQPCVTEYVAIEQAIGQGAVVVAAAGNEFEEGNPVEYPAAYPHVLSVAAVAPPDHAPSGFSNANSAIDLSAPGETVPVAVPLALDVGDAAQDGVTLADGTSFAAPMVAGAAAWLRTARPSLSGLQIADTLRNGAMDLGERGWDRDTGWGLASVPGALNAPSPHVDPLEPNDDMPFVNGTYFADPDRPVFTGSRNRSLTASVDFAEDPDDVYRIRMPRRSSLTATLRPSYGDPDLFAYHGGARHLWHTRAVVDRSRRYRGPDRVYLVNSSRRSVAGYLAVTAATSGFIDSRYTLRITRTRYRR